MPLASLQRETIGIFAENVEGAGLSIPQINSDASSIDGAFLVVSYGCKEVNRLDEGKGNAL